MLYINVLYILALSFNAIVSPCYIDNIIPKFIVNATPILFPPSRISLHLCIGYDETIGLSRIMSSNYLTHGFNNFIEKFDQRIYNNLEHRNLYVLDLDCDCTIEILRQAHSKRMFIAPTKWLLLQDRGTINNEMMNNDDNASRASTHDDSVLEILENLTIYPDSDVVLARRFDGDFLELTSVYRPSPQRGVIWEKRGNWTIKDGLRMRTFDVASARRKNLQRTALKSCIVITNPDTINHLTDYKDKLVDPSTKVNYIWVQHLVDRMNATVSFRITNTWGYRDANGSWSGMTGMLHRREIDIGGSPVFLIPERIGVVQYIHLYTHTGLSFIFRRPLLSTVTNIFALPFEWNVWLATGIFLLLVFCLLNLSTKWEYYLDNLTRRATYSNSGEPTISDNFLILLGAFAQQGYSYEPCKVPARITTLMLLLAALSLYAAYTANIVSLLQSTTDSIRTLSDLLHSPLKLGVEDNPYNRYYFKSSSVGKAILEQKIEPKGHKSNWMHLKEGVRRIRNEPFAFYAGRSPIYQVMQETYLEEEKCGLTLINYITTVHPLLVIQLHSPYAEIIKNEALKLREYGLKYRHEYRLYTPMPVCQSKISFITIGFTECQFAIIVMAYGMILSMIVLVLELLWHRKRDLRAILLESFIGLLLRHVTVYRRCIGALRRTGYPDGVETDMDRAERFD